MTDVDIRHLPKREIMLLRRRLRNENMNYPVDRLVPLPFSREELDAIHPGRILLRALRSRRYLVQEFEEPNDVRRLSCCRTELMPDGSYADGLTWDELQEIKRMAGYAGRDAAEVYPVDIDVVNVSNMRHLWVMPEGVVFSFAWRNTP